MNLEERELLLGLVALRHRLIDESELRSAVDAWSTDPSRGVLDGDARRSAEELLASHLDRNRGDASQSFASLGPPPWLDERFGSIPDGPPLTATLGGTSEMPFEAVGSPTSAGERFLVLKPHAQGGLGAVFVALDRELNREVALKQILDTRADDASSRRRFLLEAEITGRLEHPGIVPVYGLGAHPDGRPFYAMRFIRGATLDQAIRAFHSDAHLKTDASARTLALQKLLRRFLDVCNAIEFAHGRGVLHRDIKPANIVVGNHGETLVVDWGLAKVLGAEETAVGEVASLRPPSLSGSSHTLEGSTLGTIGFMSPEQARGDLDSLGPATDVYSLGATLACLVTGKPPFEGKAREILDAVVRGEAPRLRQTDPSIDRALEAICLKAMAFEPGNRYPSARSLAEDVERWLADEPVTAYRDPALTRLARWARRHRTVAASAGMLLASAVVALSVGTVLINRERSRTEASFRQARAAVDDYFTKVSESRLLDVPGLQPLRRELLEAAARYYGDFLREQGGDPAVRKEAAAASFRLAWVTQMIDKPEEAVEPAKTALSLYEELARSHPEEMEHRQLLARSHGLLGMLDSSMGRLEDALAQHRQALSIREALVMERPNDPIVRNDVIRTHSNIAGVLRELGRPQESLEEFETAAALGRELLAMPLDPAQRETDLTGQKGAWATAHYEVALLNRKRSAVLRELHRLDEADQAWRESLALFEELVREFPNDTDHPSQLAECHLEAANVLQAQGRPEEALRSQRSAEAIQRDLVAQNPGMPGFRGRLGRTQLAIASALASTGRIAESLDSSRGATETLERLVTEAPGDGDGPILLAMALTQSSKTLMAMGRRVETLPLLTRGRDLLEAAVRSNPGAVFQRSGLANLLATLGRARATMGDRPEAIAAFSRAAELSATMADQYPSQRYGEACYLALLVPLVEPKDREAAAGRAMEVLRLAVKAGYGDARTLETDTDLDPLRGREDFRTLLAKLRQNSAAAH